MAEPYRILLVDDEPSMLKALTRALDGVELRAGDGTRVVELETASTGSEALRLNSRTPFHAVLSDIRMPDGDGLWLLGNIKRDTPATEVILLTAYGTVESAVQAMKAGAADYLIKPFQVDELLVILERLAERAALVEARDSLTRQLRESSGAGRIIYASAAMDEVLRRARRVARTDSTVLLRGESGTGKDVIARAIHFESSRAAKPFIKANCAAIPEGLLESDLFGHVRGAFTGATEKKAGRFELADGGSIFLDEIGDMSLATQVKLLRVLQEREFEKVGSAETRKVDVRVIAATNRDLEEAIADGQFREDLFYRINVVTLSIPPLRDRKEDIPALVQHFLEDKAVKMGLSRKAVSDEAGRYLQEYDWPGNVRELENAIEHALVLGESDTIEIGDFPALAGGTSPPRPAGPEGEEAPASLDGKTLEEMEEMMIERALRLTGGNQSKAAEMLGITRRALAYRRVKRDGS